jgi:hypothetical protein
MFVRQMLPYTLAAGIACAVVTLNTAHANDTAVFRDALKPHGKERSLAQKYADGYACGATGPNRTVPFMPSFEKCMSGKGWVLDHYASNEIPAPGGTTVHYVDIKGDGHDHERGDAALQADTRACKATAGKNIEACLANHGWKYTLTKYGQPLARSHIIVSSPRSSSWWSSSSGSPSSNNLDDDIRHIDEMNRTIQAASDAINAGIQATNDMNAAAAQQMQLDQNLANMPLQQN